MQITAGDYDTMRQWFAIAFEFANEGQKLPSDVHPIAALDAIAKRSPERARAGLGMAINDIVEMSDGWQPETVATLDQELRALGLPSLSAMRLEVSKRISGILKRGAIRDYAEYHLARNAAEMAGMPKHEIWKLIDAYTPNPGDEVA